MSTEIEIEMLGSAVLKEALLKEVERCQGLVAEYTAMGPTYSITAWLIRKQIGDAVFATMNCDLNAMFWAYGALLKCK